MQSIQWFTLPSVLDAASLISGLYRILFCSGPFSSMPDNQRSGRPFRRAGPGHGPGFRRPLMVCWTSSELLIFPFKGDKKNMQIFTCIHSHFLALFSPSGNHRATSFPIPEAGVPEESEHHAEVPQPEDDAPADAVQQRSQPAALVTEGWLSLDIGEQHFLLPRPHSPCVCRQSVFDWTPSLPHFCLHCGRSFVLQYFRYIVASTCSLWPPCTLFLRLWHLPSLACRIYQGHWNVLFASVWIVLFFFFIFD